MAPRIYSEQVDQLYRNAAVGHVTTLINSAISAYVLWTVTARSSLLIWLASLWGITALRYLLIYRHHGARAKPDYDAHFWGRAFVVGMGAAGLAWGSAAIVLFPPDRLEYQMFIAFVLGGMSAGAAGGLAMLYSPVVAFVLGCKRLYYQCQQQY